MEWDEAIGVLDAWRGRQVIVVAYLAPGISLPPVATRLDLSGPARGVVRLDVPGLPVALRRATFIEAGWIEGQEERGLAVTQGGVRVDVFLDEAQTPAPG
jgi:hypothetical protein